jgi:hypothetical protein
VADTAAPTVGFREDELDRVRERRYTEARQAGLEHLAAVAFARGTGDVGVLRRLVKDGCPPKLIRRIVL